MQFAHYAAVVMGGALMGSVSVMLAIAMEPMLVVSFTVNLHNLRDYRLPHSSQLLKTMAAFAALLSIIDLY